MLVCTYFFFFGGGGGGGGGAEKLFCTCVTIMASS